MNKVEVLECKEENVKKMFNFKYKKDEVKNTNDQYLNLDKRIHKILDSIKNKKDPIQTNDNYKKINDDKKSIENSNYEKSTQDNT